ncbi:MAG: helix-turn-helix domain-containing protein [Eubacterium sp.]
MAQYKNGIETKNKILQIATALFAVNGFQGTTIAMIADKAEVPVGLVNYYYKKDALLGNIHYNFILDINKTIEEQIAEKLDNHLQKHLVFSQIFYHKICTSRVNKDFFYLILKKDLTLKETHDYVRNSMLSIISEFDIPIQTPVFKKLMIAEYGARKALLKDSFETNDLNITNDFINFLATITIRLTGISNETIAANIKKAEKLSPLVDVTHLRFFDI